MKQCKCGCGEAIKASRVFLNKEHQLRWMAAGGAAELSALVPVEAKQRGGVTAGAVALKNGQLAVASKKGAERVRAISQALRILGNKKPSD